MSLMLLQKLERNGFGAKRYKTKRTPRLPVGSVNLKSFKRSIFGLVGLSKWEFLWILKGTTEEIQKPRNKSSVPQHKKGRSNTVMSTAVRLIATMNFVKHHPSRECLESNFGVNWKTLWYDRRHILPIVASFMIQNSPITMPITPEDERLDYSWKGATMLIDCTSHNRNRTHPGQSWSLPWR
jgi:hypothetical protein